jgi:hypothetical protein
MVELDGGERQTASHLAQGKHVTPSFKVKPNAYSMCAQESSLHTYHTENGYKILMSHMFITQIMSYIRLNRTLLKIQQQKDFKTPQAIDRG